MSPPGYIAAAVLIVALAVAHSVLGERFLISRVLRRDQPKLFGDDSFTKQTMRFAWHATTLAWFAMAAALLLVPGDTIGWIVVTALAGTALMTVIISRGRHLSWAVELVTIGVLLFELLGN